MCERVHVCVRRCIGDEEFSGVFAKSQPIKCVKAHLPAAAFSEAVVLILPTHSNRDAQLKRRLCLACYRAFPAAPTDRVSESSHALFASVRRCSSPVVAAASASAPCDLRENRQQQKRLKLYQHIHTASYFIFAPGTRYPVRNNSRSREPHTPHTRRYRIAARCPRRAPYGSFPRAQSSPPTSAPFCTKLHGEPRCNWCHSLLFAEKTAANWVSFDLNVAYSSC